MDLKTAFGSFFTEITQGNKKLAECKTCQIKITGRTDGLKAHFARCKPDNGKVPVSGKRERSTSPPAAKRPAVTSR